MEESKDPAKIEIGCLGGLFGVMAVVCIALCVLYVTILTIGGTTVAWFKDATGLDQTTRKAQIDALNTILDYADNNPRLVKYVNRYVSNYVEIKIPNPDGDGSESVMLYFDHAKVLWANIELPYSWEQWNRRNDLEERAKQTTAENARAQLERLKTINQ